MHIGHSIIQYSDFCLLPKVDFCLHHLSVKMKMIAQDNDEQGTTSAHSTVISNAFFKPQTQMDVVQKTSYPQTSTGLDAGQSLALQSACCLWCRNDPMILHRLVAQRSGHTKSGIVLNAVACSMLWPFAKVARGPSWGNLQAVGAPAFAHALVSLPLIKMR